MGVDSSDYSALLGTIKNLMRQRKLRYQDLAEKLGLSESAVKRFFTSGDGSFSRIMEICNILEVELSDLLAESKKVEYTQVHFTLEQQEFLTKRRENIAVYWNLLVNELSVEEIQNKLRLSEKEMTKTLRELDRLDLVEWGVGGKVKTRKVESTVWAGEGPLIDMVLNDWSVEIVRRSSAQVRKDPNYALQVRTLKMLPETYQDFNKALRELTQEFEKRSNRDARFQPDKTKFMCFTTACIPEPLL